MAVSSDWRVFSEPLAECQVLSIGASHCLLARCEESLLKSQAKQQCDLVSRQDHLLAARPRSISKAGKADLSCSWKAFS